MGRLGLLVYLCHCMALLRGRSTSSQVISTTTNVETRATATVLPAVKSVRVTNRNETALTLDWDKVNNNNTFNYMLCYNGNEENINGLQEGQVVTHTVSSLFPGIEYTFTLYTVLGELKSQGFNFTNFTTPTSVTGVSVTDRNETALTLQWNKVDNNDNYNYTLAYSGNTTYISGLEGGVMVTHTVTSLSPGTEYSFTLYTVFKEVESRGFTFTNITTPSCIAGVIVTDRNETALTLQWNKVDNNNNYSYTLAYSGNTTYISGLEGGLMVTHTVTSLSPGTEYSFTLYTVFKEVESRGFTFTNITTPSCIAGVIVTDRNETALTLQWNKVDNNNNYSYALAYSGNTTYISGLEGGLMVTHTVTSLSPGTEYSFTVYTVFKEVESRGFTFTNITTPSCIAGVIVTDRNETALTLQWNKVDNNDNYNYTLAYSGNTTYISGLEGGLMVTHTVTSLSPGTEYSFTLYTVFKKVESRGFTFTNITTPSCIAGVIVTDRNETALTLQWNKVDNNDNYNYTLAYSGNTTYISGLEGGLMVTHTVTSLSPGTEYSFTLYTVFKKVESRGVTFTNITIPARVTGLQCEYASGGYGLTLVWDPPTGRRTAVKVILNGKSFGQAEDRLFIGELLPTQWYTMIVIAVSGLEQSVPVSIICQTDPRGVIAGVLVFLLTLILCIGVFIWYRKSKMSGVLSKIKSSTEDKLSSNIYKSIPLMMFPNHFKSMSRDENHGFCEEYESLDAVGTDQSRIAAELPENKSKNRFINVLPYDSSRVKLQTGAHSDYINASYIPGYSNSCKKYIAAQGPLPSTVCDFWRMVWEQKSQVIVMLTNCTEGGRIKCEQYWPLDYTPCVYGNLMVTVLSEHKERSWTLRQFVVRDKATSEEQTVAHCHFTSWPDHGVPRATDELLQFRGIVRQHVESFPFTGPTVVHCSAGVGRTGTLIALDILLQQLEKEEAVSVAGCVQHMRLCRPLMVQTESQYMFLHQCIVDSIQPKEDSQHVQDSIYENADIIYANTLAL